MIEVGVLFDRDHRPIYWHEPPGRSTVSLPDSRTLWEALWENREGVLGFAHSHPGCGMPSLSHEDVTTFSAVERALGKALTWWIISEDREAAFQMVGPHSMIKRYSDFPGNLPWLAELRRRSYTNGG